MRGTVFSGCLILVLILSISSCDWTTNSQKTSSWTDLLDVSGLYILSDGWAPWDTIMIWHYGSTLRAQDSRGTGLIWEGTIGGQSGTSGAPAQWQVYLQCQNQHSGLTEWIRGRIFQTEDLLLGPILKLEAVYTRSDGAETSPFIAVAEQNQTFWETGDQTQ